MPNKVLIIVSIIALLLVVAVAAHRQLVRMTLGTFHIDKTGKASYSGVFEFERSPEDISGYRWVLLRVKKTDLSLPNEEHRRNDSSYYGGFSNPEERGK